MTLIDIIIRVVEVSLLAVIAVYLYREVRYGNLPEKVLTVEPWELGAGNRPEWAVDPQDACMIAWGIHDEDEGGYTEPHFCARALGHTGAHKCYRHGFMGTPVTCATTMGEGSSRDYH